MRGKSSTFKWVCELICIMYSAICNRKRYFETESVILKLFSALFQAFYKISTLQKQMQHWCSSVLITSKVSVLISVLIDKPSLTILKTSRPRQRNVSRSFLWVLKNWKFCTISLCPLSTKSLVMSFPKSIEDGSIFMHHCIVFLYKIVLWIARSDDRDSISTYNSRKRWKALKSHKRTIL